MKIMHVCLDISRDGWGVSKVCETLSAEQERLDNKVIVVGLMTYRWMSQDCNLWAGANAAVYRKGFFGIWYIFNVVLSAIRFRPDVVHIHGLWGEHVIAGRFLQFLRFKCFVSPHGMLSVNALKISPKKKKIFALFFQNDFLTGCEGIVASCVRELDDIASCVDAKSATVIPNGTVEVVSDKISTNVKASKIISYIGRIDKKKGLENLLKSWLMIPDRKNYVLNIYGNDSRGFKGELQSFVSRNQLNDVFFFPPVYEDHFVEIVNNSSFFVLPSLGEGWPLIIGEVLSLKCPVLVTPETSYTMAEGEGFGLVVNSDPESLCLGLAKMMSFSNSQLEIMGECGRAWVGKNLNWATISLNYIEFYEGTI